MWLDGDRDAALEWLDHLSSLCPGCGHDRAESMDVANAGTYVAEPVQCHACAARDAEVRTAREARQGGQWADGAFDGLMYVVRQRGG